MCFFNVHNNIIFINVQQNKDVLYNGYTETKYIFY